MCNYNLRKQELDINGFTVLGKMLTDDEVSFFKNNLIDQKNLHIQKHGIEKLNQYGELEMLRNVGSFHENYIKLVESDWLNDFINISLNDKAIIHGYHGIITTSKSYSPNALPLKFHRDSPWFKDIRTCILVLMPLVDFTDEVGPTEVVPSTHMFEDMPCKEFLENNAKKITVPAGHVFVMDGTLWHRAGINRSKNPRPLLQMNITAAFFKQQIDVWSTDKFLNCSDLAKKRLGYSVRTYVDPDEMLSDDRKWKSGNYDISNLRIR